MRSSQSRRGFKARRNGEGAGGGRGGPPPSGDPPGLPEVRAGLSPVPAWGSAPPCPPPPHLAPASRRAASPGGAMLVQSLRGERAVTKRGARGERRRDLIEIGDAQLPRVPLAAGMRAPVRGAGAGAVPGPSGGHRAATKSPGAEGREGRSRVFRSPRGLTARRQDRPTARAERLRGLGAPVSAGRAGVAGASRRIPARIRFPHAALVTATLIKL